MSLIARAKTALSSALCLLWLSLAVPSCAVLNSSRPSAVAQGKYFASGEPHFDQFFIGLYLLQLQMGEARRVPLDEKQRLARALGLPDSASDTDLLQRLRAQALDWARAGTHVRLDLDAPEQPGTTIAVVRSNAQPNADREAPLIKAVEGSATALLASSAEMKRAEEALARLAQDRTALAARVDVAFEGSGYGKQRDVKRNLADAERLIGLMSARAIEVREVDERFLAGLGEALNTDDGSVPQKGAEDQDDPAARDAKKSGAKTRPKRPAATATAAHPKAAGDETKAKSVAPSKAAPTAPRSKPPSDDAPAKAAAPGKAQTAPKDFEP